MNTLPYHLPKIAPYYPNQDSPEPMPTRPIECSSVLVQMQEQPSSPPPTELNSNEVASQGFLLPVIGVAVVLFLVTLTIPRR